MALGIEFLYSNLFAGRNRKAAPWSPTGRSRSRRIPSRQASAAACRKIYVNNVILNLLPENFLVENLHSAQLVD